MTGATDGEALIVQQAADLADHQHVLALIIATVATALDRLELGEFLLPVAQHVGLYVTQVADFTDGGFEVIEGQARVPILADDTPDALAAIDAWSWPGNVRELENRIKRAVIMADGKSVSAADLDLDDSAGDALPLNLRTVREIADRKAIARALSRSDGNLWRVAPARDQSPDAL